MLDATAWPLARHRHSSGGDRLMNTMRAARAHRREGPEQPARETAPRPGPGGTVIAVRAASTTLREPARNATRTDSLDGSGRERTPVIPTYEVSGAAAGATAPALAAKVTATASARDGEFVADLAAQNAIGHTDSRFEDHVADVDVVRDTAGGDTHTRPWGLLPPRRRPCRYRRAARPRRGPGPCCTRGVLRRRAGPRRTRLRPDPRRVQGAREGAPAWQGRHPCRGRIANRSPGRPGPVPVPARSADTAASSGPL